MLPNGGCVQVGSLESVTLPDGTLPSLCPETPQDEFGTAFAADEGNSAGDGSTPISNVWHMAIDR